MEQAPYTVVGDFAIQSCDGTDVHKPGTVLLCQSNDCAVHSQDTNIRALVEARHVKPIEAKPPADDKTTSTATAAKPKGGGGA